MRLQLADLGAASMGKGRAIRESLLRASRIYPTCALGCQSREHPRLVVGKVARRSRVGWGVAGRSRSVFGLHDGCARASKGAISRTAPHPALLRKSTFPTTNL